MKCPHCGTENRPDVRFCKNCGRPLDAAPSPVAPPARQQPGQTPPRSTSRSCPHCGSPVKPQARFCPRCGETLTPQPTAQAQPHPQRPHPQTPRAQPPQPQPREQAEPRYTQPQQPSPGKTQPQPSGGEQRADYVQPQASPPPPTDAPSRPVKDKQSGFPLWLWILIGVLTALLLIVITFLGFQLFFADDEASSEVPSTETVTVTLTEETVEAAVPPTSTQEMATEPPTVGPTATSTVSQTTVTPESTGPIPPGEGEEGAEGEGQYVARLTLSPPTADVAVGETVTLTATVENTGDTNLGISNFEPWGAWTAYLKLTEEPQISLTNPITVPPQDSKNATFVFQANSPGQAEIKLEATILNLQTSQPIRRIEADPVQITVK